MQPNPQFPAGLVTFTEEILNGKLHFCVVHRVLFSLFFPDCQTKLLYYDRLGFTGILWQTGSWMFSNEKFHNSNRLDGFPVR